MTADPDRTRDGQMPDWQIVLIRGLCLAALLFAMASCDTLMRMVLR